MKICIDLHGEIPLELLGEFFQYIRDFEQAHAEEVLVGVTFHNALPIPEILSTIRPRKLALWEKSK